MYKTDREKQSIVIEGNTYSRKLFIDNTYVPDFASKSDFHYQLYIFLKAWFNPSPFLTVRTSGSTGNPKEMHVEKQRMINSAMLTCDYLKLQQGETALLCMPLEYIAGKMMVVRCLVAGMDLQIVSPSGNPLKYIDKAIQFTAMTSMQVYNCLGNKAEKIKLSAIKILIIGGGALDKDIEEQLKNSPNPIYSTYGMTETLSHIALRKINGENNSDNYIPFSSVKISLSEKNTLIVDAPLIAKEIIYTNDIVAINPDGSFCIIGRTDNTINSGGIKVQIEEIEKTLSTVIKGRFAISSVPDTKFGEVIVLVIEKNHTPDKQKIKDALPSKIHIPRKLFLINHLPMTNTNKVARHQLKEILADSLLKLEDF